MCNEVENMFERYNDAKKELEYHKKEAERLENDVEYLEREIHQMQDGFSKLAGEAQDSGEKVEYHKFAEDVQKKMGEKDEVIKELKEENRYLGRRIGELNHEIMELCGQINKKDELIKELEEIVENHRQMIRKNRDEKMELTEEVNKQAECLREKESHISDLEACLKVARSEIEKLYTEKDEHIEELDHELGDAKTENERLRKCIEEKDERIKALEPLGAIDVRELLKDYRSFHDEIKELKEENESLKREVDIWKEGARKNVDSLAEFYKKLEDKNKLIDYMIAI